MKRMTERLNASNNDKGILCPAHNEYVLPWAKKFNRTKVTNQFDLLQRNPSKGKLFIPSMSQMEEMVNVRLDLTKRE